ncbi:MAG: tripartite tricarboxylate transporter permease [Alphaproteobacteria bacterium]|nr:tripartite tricarboxylate transporter permease [Alphaproteobacteria bacterium]
MEQFLVGFGLIFEFQNIILMVVGLIVGIVIGAVPGLNVPLAVALALPFTFSLPPLAGLSMLIGIYKGGTYGGSISAILINVPGTPAAAATALDGNKLARNGQAGRALKLSLYASVFGELMSDILLIVLAVQIARIALLFGPHEFFALGVFALTIIGLVSGKSLVKGLIAGAAGILFATVGLDPIEGEVRLAFDVYELTGGLKFIALIIGAFAISEALVQVEQRAVGKATAHVLEVSGDRAANTLSPRELRKLLPTAFRGAAIGSFIGAVPGIGAAIAAFLSYGVARRLSKTPEQFGEGALEGVTAAESANNGVTGSTLIPLLTLGIPGDVITAIMLGALTVHGLIPGPTLFQQQGDFVTALFIGMLMVTFLHLVVGYLGLPLFIRAVRVPPGILFPLVVILCVTGTFVATSSIFDVFVMLGFGVVGYLMVKFGFPIPPLLIGFILGPLIEVSLRQAMILSNNNALDLLSKPVSAGFLILTAVVIASVGWQRLREKRSS